jgi:hypothetical protein
MQDNVPPDILVYHDWTVEVRIPPGKSDGEAYLMADGNLPILNDQPLHGDWTRSGVPPLSDGDAYAHAPDSPADDGWFIHAWLKATGSAWEETHREIAMPGAYRYHVRLSAPAAVETTWTGTVSGYTFNAQELQRQGFAPSFRLYDDHTSH